MIAAPEGLVEIALIEPDAGDAARIRDLVLAGSLPSRVADAMAEDQPDLGRAEIILIGLQGLGAAEKALLARLHAEFPRTPLVVLAGADASAWVDEAVSLGAFLVLLKSQLTTAKLSSTLRYCACYLQNRG